MSIWRFVARRVAFSAVIVLATAVLTFIVIHLAPGDPALLMTGGAASPDLVAIVRQQYGLNLPLSQQLFIYLSKLITGNFGYSISFGEPVISVIMTRLPQTILLVGTSLIIAIALGIFLALLAARKPFSFADRAINVFSLTLFSIPVFWLGLVLIFGLALYIPIFPTGGMFDVTAQNTLSTLIPNILWHMFLPTVTLSALFIATYARILRAGLIRELSTNYVLMARSKGVTEHNILYHHVLKNAILPVITVAGIQFGLMVGGVVLTETVFSWPGVGSLLVQAISSRDYPLITGVFIITSISVAISNLVADIVYGAIDPRVRTGLM